MDRASLDGRIAPASETVIPVTDDGLLRGDGVFEVARVYGGRAFALDEHFERLALSGGNLRLPIDLDSVRAEVHALLEDVGKEDYALRIVVTRGGRRLAIAEPLPTLPDPLRLASVTYAPTRILDGIKSLSYAANMLTTRLAKEAGGDEALLVTPHGRVLEAPTSTFFWVRDGVLLTPPLDDHILASITRSRIFDLVAVTEESATLDDLRDADEAFIASSLREVAAVSAIDDSELSPPGPMTAEIAGLLRARIAEELAAVAPR